MFETEEILNLGKCGYKPIISMNKFLDSKPTRVENTTLTLILPLPSNSNLQFRRSN